ncbi:MAG: ComEC family competence protein [Alphaproteobacteria bacterium]|nr:ComEC family competence protein [Alphaproteobacteria bacterium]
MGRVSGFLAALLERGDRARLILWLPVAFGAGIALYFDWPDEPPLRWGAYAGGAALTLVGLTRALGWPWRAALAVTFVAAGFLTAQIGAELQSAPVLLARIGPTAVTGRVTNAEPTERGRRLLLADVTIAGLDPARTPRRLRLTDRIAQNQDLAPGDRVRIPAMLLPPPEPVAPGTYDFARDAWFQGVGAVGFTLGRAERLASAESRAIATLRHHIGGRIREALPGSMGSIAAALIIGERAAIPQADLDALRDSGLAHLLSISGLHMTLVAGLVFALVRGALALWPAVAGRYPIKKWAAIAAIAGAAFYLALSGASVPAQRSFLSAAIVLIAIILDRNALSMRLLALAAMVVMTLKPESLLGPSFQMSFAAVLALIAGYEASRRWRRANPPRTWWQKALRYAIGVAATSLLAGGATTPFALYHFGRFVSFGVVANLIAVPLTGFWIMPWALLAVLLMPLGLEGPALTAMAWGLEAVMWTAHWVAAWPDAALLVPAMPRWGLLSATVGLLWLCLWVGRWRWLGLSLLAAGLASPATHRPPDLYVEAEMRQVAVRTESGGLAITGDPTSFTAEIWLRRDGLLAADPWPRSEERSGLRCDGAGCVARFGDSLVALALADRALAEDCREATLVLTRLGADRRCRGMTTVIDRWARHEQGAMAIWIEADGPRIETTRAYRGERPWVQAAQRPPPGRRTLSSAGRGRRGGPAP